MSALLQVYSSSCKSHLQRYTLLYSIGSLQCLCMTYASKRCVQCMCGQVYAHGAPDIAGCGSCTDAVDGSDQSSFAAAIRRRGHQTLPHVPMIFFCLFLFVNMDDTERLHWHMRGYQGHLDGRMLTYSSCMHAVVLDRHASAFHDSRACNVAHAQ